MKEPQKSCEPVPDEVSPADRTVSAVSPVLSLVSILGDFGSSVGQLSFGALRPHFPFFPIYIWMLIGAHQKTGTNETSRPGAGSGAGVFWDPLETYLGKDPRGKGSHASTSEHIIILLFLLSQCNPL